MLTRRFVTRVGWALSDCINWTPVVVPQQPELNGMRRYFDQIIETAGMYNTVVFNDDTRAFPTIPVRHDVWRRASANWLSGQLVRGIITEEDAVEMTEELAVGLARKAYRLETPA